MPRSLQVEQGPVTVPSQDIVRTEVWDGSDCPKGPGHWVAAMRRAGT